ncbi:conserved hypothetical protein [Marinobacter nauticus ATCC 49840]|nr:conserved hypothetical protein [Marinobacter nauticus ATCC 49840]
MTLFRKFRHEGDSRYSNVTVEELIAQLQALPPGTPVLVEGYETGFDNILKLAEQQVGQYRNAQKWDGEDQTLDRSTKPERAALKRW